MCVRIVRMCSCLFCISVGVTESQLCAAEVFRKIEKRFNFDLLFVIMIMKISPSIESLELQPKLSSIKFTRDRFSMVCHFYTMSSTLTAASIPNFQCDRWFQFTQTLQIVQVLDACQFIEFQWQLRQAEAHPQAIDSQNIQEIQTMLDDGGIIDGSNTTEQCQSAAISHLVHLFFSWHVDVWPVAAFATISPFNRILVTQQRK